MLKLDFLEYKTIIRYLLVISTLLMAGYYLKDVIAILFILTILSFLITNNVFKAIEVFFVWFFIYNFFIGQDYITNIFISKYLAKPSFLLFVIFICFFFKIPSRLFDTRFVRAWIFYLILVLISSVTQGQSPFVIISASSFFLVFLLLQARGISGDQYNRLLNLFIAVAIIQTVVSYLQVTQIIAPPTKMMDDGSGGKYLWDAGLDDVASGTFGAGASHLTSWFAAFMSLFMLIMWASTKNNKYIFILILAFLQFATVDSKIITGVTLVMLIYFLIYLFRRMDYFKINIVNFIIIISILSVGAYGFYLAWNTYYEYYGEKTGGTRTSVKAVFNNEAEGSFSIVWDHIGEWGKITAFKHIIADYIDHEPIQLIWGYGIQGYDFNGKMSYIESQDSPIMQLNNFTRSRSGLIRLFATSGFLGFVVFIIAVYLWFNQINRKTTNHFDLILTSILKIYLPFSLLAAFLYPVQITSIPLVIFAAIISIYTKLSDLKITTAPNSTLTHSSKIEEADRLALNPKGNRIKFSYFSTWEQNAKKE